MTPTLFHLLLALAEGPKHGYALLGRVEERTGGRIELGPSSLYYSLGRLEDAGLIREVDPAVDGDGPHEERRRYYGLTARGREFLTEELGVLSGIMDHARAMGFEPGAAG